jgi:pimeloyl-ACP methyl ester carboxylesterase
MTYAFGDYELDTRLRELRHDGEMVPVQPQVFDLLAFLVERRDRAVGKDELLEAVWGGAYVTEGSLQRAISQARSAIGDGAHEAILTLPRRGYRFAAEVAVRALEEAPGAPSEAHPFRPRYAVSGEVHIAYHVEGHVEAGGGSVDVAHVFGWTLPMASALELASMQRHLARLGERARVVLFDKRGTGLSDRVKELPGLEQRMDDLRAVLDEVGSRRAVLVGHSEGGPLSILFAASFPERTAGLVLVGSFARFAAAPGYPWGWSRRRMEELRGYVRRSWGAGASLAAIAAERRHEPGLGAWAARAEQMGASPGAALELIEMNLAIDVREILPLVRVPTVVLHRADDPVIDAGNGRYLAERIPGARLLEVPGEDHVFLFDGVELLEAEIEALLEGAGRAPQDRFLTTALVAEAEASGGDRLAEAAGPVLARWRATPAAAPAATVAGCFDGPARAVECGRALLAAAPRRLAVRVGVHTGEGMHTAEGVAGPAVDGARAIARVGRPGEVTASRVVADLLPGSGLVFAPRGELTAVAAGGASMPLFAASGA